MARSVPVYAAPGLAFLLVAASFALQGRVGFNLMDEGYLWQGVRQVLMGDVPIRDFQSYDPGRYYWSAVLMGAFGSDGILALRMSVALFQACGLTVALLLLRRVAPQPAIFAVMALVFLFWFFPRHKLFDLSLSIFAVYAGVVLLERPSVLRHFGVGVYVGLAAVFGRNHGVYACVALFGLVVLAALRIDRSNVAARVAAFGAGVVTGYLPMAAIALTQPGFLQALLDSVWALFRIRATNLGLPVPWPWTVDHGQPWPWVVHGHVVGLTFIAMPLVYVAGALIVARARAPQFLQRNSVFVASIAVGLVYMHYAFARADVGHLTHAIYPFLLAVVSFPGLLETFAGWGRVAVPVALLGYSTFAAALMSPSYPRYVQRSYVYVDVQGEKLSADRETAAVVRAIEGLKRDRMRPGQQLAVMPYWPALYALVGGRAPVWEFSSVFAGDVAGQERFISELESRRVEWAIVGNSAQDGREDRRFSRTHPLTWNYLESHYAPVPLEGLPADFRLLRRRSAGVEEAREIGRQ